MKVLFVCVHNSGRSQMAEAYFNHFARESGRSDRAESAGTLGGGQLNPVVVEAMREDGVPLDGHFPKALTADMVRRTDRVISMGCGVDAAQCPVRFLVAEDWGLEDPAGQTLDAVRQIRDAIKDRVLSLSDNPS